MTKKCDLLITGCSEIVMGHTETARGADAGKYSTIEHCDIAVKNGIIYEIGRGLPYTAAETINGSGMTVMAGFVDSHTHLVFGGNRSEEFLMRLQGASYEEIAASGGGIKNTVMNTRMLSEEELFKSAEKRLLKAFSYGTTTMEVKSGYGLNTEDEIKMLRVAGRLKKKYPDTIVVTFMGPHEIPDGLTEEKYMDIVCEEMLPRVKEEGLAEFADIFTEKGVFGLTQTERYFRRAAELGFKLKIHADELFPLGGTELAVKHHAVSADHLMRITDSGISAICASGTIATILPGTSFFLMSEVYAPVRKLISGGAAVSLASDYNPGSNHGFNMQFVMNLAAMRLKMTMGEILNSVGVNAAAAVDRHDRGVISKGKKADLIMLDIPDHRHMLYTYAVNNVARVIKNGKTIVKNESHFDKM